MSLRLSDELIAEFFTVTALNDFGLVIVPGAYIITHENLQQFTKAIYDKIERYESSIQ